MKQPEGKAVIEVAGGFVGKQKAWLADDRAGDGDPLLFSAPTVSAARRRAVTPGQPKTEFFDIAARVGVRLPGNGKRQEDVFQNGRWSSRRKS